ncbi:ATP-binding protein [Microlunatus capsulatus]|uniref:histidine kinase n=1 Tax=Microlunatus capsulatus TaxID=99117 RepID=A0ABS4ZA75_9ACTN|nr:ATP-binding protein [Microlunatus capsulatus]MBP2417954.1 signal transduction histidine kinase [Microlunatus capsulatus]
MTSDPTPAARLSPDELATLFLFEALEPEQLSWLSERGYVETRAAGTAVFTEGEEATCFFVLLAGTMTLQRAVEGTQVEFTRTSQRGVYSGATQAFVPSAEAPRYLNTATAVTDAEFWVIDANVFGPQIRLWFPMAMHMLEGVTIGYRSSQAIIGQRERLLSLGRLSAGLTHELNNPAAAAVRATAALRERVSKMRGKLAHLATSDVDPKALVALTELQEAAVERMVKAEELSPMEVGDAEDALSDWLDDHRVPNAWDLAPTLVAAGVGTDWLDEIAGTMPAEQLADGIHWVTYALDTEQLMGEIEDSTHRISALVGAAKQYSQMDRAAYADIDVRDGLISTMVMLGHKIKASGKIAVVKELAPDLPTIPAHPAELNQVWTNLIDNAVHAMPDGGTLTVRTALEGDHVLVEVGDTGTGIPEELQQRIFEPFFTTKPVGEGTGLGLDISYRVVTQRHGGDLRVVSRPGDTRFQVRLPLTAPAAAG